MKPRQSGKHSNFSGNRSSEFIISLYWGNERRKNKDISQREYKKARLQPPIDEQNSTYKKREPSIEKASQSLSESFQLVHCSLISKWKTEEPSARENLARVQPINEYNWTYLNWAGSIRKAFQSPSGSTHKDRRCLVNIQKRNNDMSITTPRENSTRVCLIANLPKSSVVKFERIPISVGIVPCNLLLSCVVRRKNVKAWEDVQYITGGEATTHLIRASSAQKAYQSLSESLRTNRCRLKVLVQHA